MSDWASSKALGCHNPYNFKWESQLVTGQYIPLSQECPLLVSTHWEERKEIQKNSIENNITNYRREGRKGEKSFKKTFKGYFQQLSVLNLMRPRLGMSWAHLREEFISPDLNWSSVTSSRPSLTDLCKSPLPGLLCNWRKMSSPQDAFPSAENKWPKQPG